ncbi:MAG: amino acid ABC transporter substrate-binding protein [Chloroflexi bacterium]|nr:amino acid ABC transporter substrate-binding protein [Chloroflexota bacterium]
MKKKVLFSVIALALVALVALPLFGACDGAEVAPAAKDKIVCGMARPISGPMAIIGDSAFAPVYNTWVPIVNDGGGIYMAEYGKSLPIELKIYDDKSDVGTMTRLTEKLILEDKVDFLWPACGSAFVFAQGPIANKYDYVLVTAEGGATTIKDALPSLPYLFVGLSFSDWYQIPVFADMLAEKGVKTAYVTYIADVFGIEYSGVAGNEFGRVGIKIIGNVSLPPSLKDFAPVILDAKASGADVFCVFGYPDQVMPATGTAIALGYNPKAMIVGPGGNFGFYHTTFGPMVEGICSFTIFDRDSSPALADLADILYTDKPEELQDWWGHALYWAGLDCWKAAVEKAGVVDQGKVRDILATEKLDTVLGETWFTMFGDGGGMLAKECHPGEIGQWQNGVFRVVGGGPWPATNINSAFTYPKPAWPAPPK